MKFKKILLSLIGSFAIIGCGKMLSTSPIVQNDTCAEGNVTTTTGKSTKVRVSSVRTNVTSKTTKKIYTTFITTTQIKTGHMNTTTVKAFQPPYDMWVYYGNGIEYQNQPDFIKVRIYSSAEGEVQVPSKIFDKPVTELTYCYSDKVTSVILPDTITTIDNFSFMCKNLVSINVDSKNQNYATKDGILFNKDLTQLLVYPPQKNNEKYVIPESVSTVCEGAFSSNKNLKEIIVSKNVRKILTSAFLVNFFVNLDDGNMYNEKINFEKIYFLNPECEIDDDPSTICNVNKSYWNLNDEKFNFIYDFTFTGTIYGYEGSTAQKYAEKYGYKFEVLKDEPIISEPKFGDPTGDSRIDAVDASMILANYAAFSTGKKTPTDEDYATSDINKDKKIDSLDSSIILAFYAYTSTNEPISLEDYLVESSKPVTTTTTTTTTAVNTTTTTTWDIGTAKTIPVSTSTMRTITAKIKRTTANSTYIATTTTTTTTSQTEERIPGVNGEYYCGDLWMPYEPGINGSWWEHNDGTRTWRWYQQLPFSTYD